MEALNVKKAGAAAGRAVRYFVLAFGSLVTLYPLIFMCLVGFFTKEEYWATELSLFPIPTQPTIENYLALLDRSRTGDVLIPFLNTLAVTVTQVAVTVVTVLFCAYAFTRLRWRGQNAVFFVLLATSMLPSTMRLIRTYTLYGQFGILDSYLVYFIGMPAINIMGTYITMQYFRSVPTALDEAARIDGANVMQIMWRVLFPVAKPIFGYIIITTAIGTWNNWQTSFFYTESTSLRTLPAVLSSVSLSTGGIPDYPFMITLGLLITIPTLIVYLVFQKYIVLGLASAGIKE